MCDEELFLNEFQREVIDKDEVRSLLPFPYSGGHILLAKLVLEYVQSLPPEPHSYLLPYCHFQVNKTYSYDLFQKLENLTKKHSSVCAMSRDDKNFILRVITRRINFYINLYLTKDSILILEFQRFFGGDIALFTQIRRDLIRIYEESNIILSPMNWNSNLI